jgi:hypothetical protein
MDQSGVKMENYDALALKAIQSLALQMSKMSPEQVSGAVVVIKWWVKESRIATYRHLGRALFEFLPVLEQAEVLHNLMKLVN